MSSSMKQRNLVPMADADPVISVWLSPENTYAFVEFRTVETANIALVSRWLALSLPETVALAARSA